MDIRLYMAFPRTTALGPGERYAVWTQGCLKRCPGCISPKSRDLNGGYVRDTSGLASEVLASGLEGLTVSGGEPFLQAEAVSCLIEEARRERDIGVCLYTGFLLEELEAMEDPQVSRLLGLVDILIDGPYVEAENDGASLRGSSNQRALCLTGRYKGHMGMYGAPGRRIELYAQPGGAATVIGIPPRNIGGLVRLEDDE
jgi:anaerobic ribonucleoside-triphosphate reductase activating protein